MPEYLNIFIVTWNSSESIKGLLGSIPEQKSLHIRILVVDNNSNDKISLFNTIACYKSKFEIIIIENSTNEGYAGGNNIAKKYLDDNNIKGDLLIINPDCILSERSIDETVRIVYRDSKIAAAMIRTLSEDGDLIYNSLILKGYKHRYNKIDTKSESVDTDYLAGSFIFLRRCYFHGHELFNPEFFMYWEEADLSLRILASGLKITSVNSSHIVRRPNEKYLSIRAIYYYNRNAVKMLSKNYFSGSLFGLIAFIVKNFISSIVMSIRIRSIAPVFEVVIGVYDGIRNVSGKCRRHG